MNYIGAKDWREVPLKGFLPGCNPHPITACKDNRGVQNDLRFFYNAAPWARTSSERVVAKMDCQVCMDWNQELLFRGSAHDDAMSQSFTVKANSASSAFFIS